MGEKTTCVRRRNIVVVERRRVAEWKDGQLCTGEPGVIISDWFKLGARGDVSLERNRGFDSITRSSSIKPSHFRFLSRPTGGMSPPICQVSAADKRTVGGQRIAKVSSSTTRNCIYLSIASWWTRMFLLFRFQTFEGIFFFFLTVQERLDRRGKDCRIVLSGLENYWTRFFTRLKNCVT